MKAMILAAGLGTRLRPLTDGRPKALVEVGGRTLLEITLTRLHGFGVREVIVNVHHFADMIVEYLERHHNFNMRIEISHEENLLDTGGGLRKAAWFFLEATSGREMPFLLHNVDVISTIDLARMLRFHNQHGGLATLAVQDRSTSRLLLFDHEGNLCGRRVGPDQQDEIVRTAGYLQPRAFAGIHVISPELLSQLKQEGAFSIIDSYLGLAAQGADIKAFRAGEYYWRDAGSLASLKQAAVDAAQRLW